MVTGTLVETKTSLLLENVVAGSIEIDETLVPGSTPGLGSTLELTPTPEPGSALLLILGGSAVLGWRRRREGRGQS
jgi:hypothetical protein